VRVSRDVVREQGDLTAQTHHVRGLDTELLGREGDGFLGSAASAGRAERGEAGECEGARRGEGEGRWAGQGAQSVGGEEDGGRGAAALGGGALQRRVAEGRGGARRAAGCSARPPLQHHNTHIIRRGERAELFRAPEVEEEHAGRGRHRVFGVVSVA
jgi:hypothetical protein